MVDPARRRNQRALRAVPTFAVCAFLLFPGCGGGDTKTVTERIEEGAAGPARTTAIEEPRDDCERAILADRAGRCETIDGFEDIISAPRGSVKLDELEAAYRSVEVTDTISSDIGRATAKVGTFVIVRVAVTNLTNGPQTFNLTGDSTLFSFGEKSYSENFDAANGLLQDSFVSQTGEIQPGQTVEGALVYDVPTTVAEKVKTGERGAVSFSNFSDFGIDDAQQVGTLRLGDQAALG